MSSTDHAPRHGVAEICGLPREGEYHGAPPADATPVFDLQPAGADLVLRLSRDLTIDDARPLFTAISAAVRSAERMRVDARQVTRVHLAILQVLLAAASKLPVQVIATSDAWDHALSRYGLAETILSTRDS